MGRLCVLALLIVAVSAHIPQRYWQQYVRFRPQKSTARPLEDLQWKEYKLKFGKFYDTESEELKRYTIWKQHLKDIQQHNANPKNKFTKGLNQFHDMTHEEFRQQMLGCYKIPKNFTSKGSRWLPPSNVQVPYAVDWRQKGYVTLIKDQGRCGSCWAFSSTGSLEGQMFRKTGRLHSLSEQNLIDCTKSYENHGCHGGWMDSSFEYVRDNKGIDIEARYPYFGMELKYCYYRPQYSYATVTGYYDTPAGDENALKIAVAKVGPISVAIHVMPSFMSYRSGVYNEPSCENTLEILNHAVLIVGYGTEDGQDYWLVKNSWGTLWGEHGYIKMSRNRNDQCGIALKASFPIV